MIANKLFVAGVVFFIVGCATRAEVKPRSQVVSEAQSSGISMPSVDQDRQAFIELEKEQERRLLKLVRERSSIDFRDPSYVIGAGDKIEIIVFDVPELNVSVPVRQSGFISLPLIGAVPAAGSTEADLVDAISSRLSTYVRSPQVSVFISDYGSQHVAVMGAVQNPGTYSLKKRANSILELISEAGGVARTAGSLLLFIPAELSGLSSDDAEGRARLALASDDAAKPANSGIELYLDQVLGTSGGIPLEIPVRGGDMIVVPDAGTVVVEGEVTKPGSYELGQKMTLLGSLAAAGGIGYSALVDEVEVVRAVGLDRKVHYVVNLKELASGSARDVRLRNGDIVKVPTHGGRRMAQDTFDGITKLINFGVGGTVNLAP